MGRGFATNCLLTALKGDYFGLLDSDDYIEPGYIDRCVFMAVENKLVMVKPKVKLVGTDGNVFAVIGRCARALKKAGQPDKAKEMTEAAFKAKSYDEALGVCMEYVDAY